MAYKTAPVTNVLSMGINLYPCPITPGFASVKMRAINRTTSNQSPFTGTTQMLLWPGGDSWAAQVSLPVLGPKDAALWTAWLLSLCGRTHAFQVGDQLYSQGNAFDTTGRLPSFPSYIPQNAGFTGGLNLTVPVNAAVVGSYTVNLTGAPHSLPNVLSPGDYMQIGYRLYRCTGYVNSDANGNLSNIPVWPSIREVPAYGTAVDTINPVGLFRLASDEVDWAYSPDRKTHLQFDIVEVK